jgi:hypothetical protein
LSEWLTLLLLLCIDDILIEGGPALETGERHDLGGAILSSSIEFFRASELLKA